MYLFTYIKRINIMENKIEILIRQNRMLMQQLLRLSEDLEIANERIDKLEKPKESEGEKGFSTVRASCFSCILVISGRILDFSESMVWSRCPSRPEVCLIVSFLYYDRE